MLGIYVKTQDRHYHQFVEKIAIERYGIDVHGTLMDRKILRGELKRSAPAPRSPISKTADLCNEDSSFKIAKHEVAYFVEFKSKEDDYFRWTWKGGKQVPEEKPSFITSCDTNVQKRIDFDANILLPQLTRQLRGETNRLDPVPIGDDMVLFVTTCHLRYRFLGPTEEIPTEGNVTIGTLSGKGILLGADNIFADKLLGGSTEEAVDNHPANLQ